MTKYVTAAFIHHSENQTVASMQTVRLWKYFQLLSQIFSWKNMKSKLAVNIKHGLINLN